MNVHIQCEHPRGQAAAARLRRRARAFLAKLGKDDAELSILLVGDRGMRRLNRTWRGQDVPTDVLSFPPAGRAGALLGDVVLSLDTAARVARAERRPMEEELDRYLVHGILHLLGFDHERGPEDAREMASREEQVLGGAGMIGGAPPRPRPPAGRTKRGAAPAGAGKRTAAKSTGAKATGAKSTGAKSTGAKSTGAKSTRPKPRAAKAAATARGAPRRRTAARPRPAR